MEHNKENRQQHESANAEVKAIVAQFINLVKDGTVSNEAEETDLKEQKDEELEPNQSLSFEDVVDMWNDKIEPLIIKLFKLKEVKIEPEQIKLPLSEIDYMRIRGLSLLNHASYWDFWKKASPELRQAYDDMEFDCLYQKYPNCGVWDEDVIWTKPRSITLDNVNEIKDPLAWWVALKYIIKEWQFDLRISQSLQKFPGLKKIIEEAAGPKLDS